MVPRVPSSLTLSFCRVVEPGSASLPVLFANNVPPGHAALPPLVLHVIHHLRTGGMENGLVNLINRMVPTDFRHAIACIDDSDSALRKRIVRDDVDVFELHRAHRGAAAVRRDIHRLCRKLRPSIVHGRNLSGLDALVPAWLAGVPVRVHGEHGWDIDNLDGRQWRPALLRRVHAPLVSRYVTVSHDLARFLERRIGVSSCRITTICNGVDTERFAPRPPPAALGLPASFFVPGVVRLGTIGRLQPVKDQMTLLRAFARMLELRVELRSRARLIVVGDGPSSSGLRRLGDELGIADLLWMPGATTETPAWFNALDVFVLPSLNEGISNAILEAMASGLPVLATDVGGNPELVDNRVVGRLIQPGDVDGLAVTMAEYIDDDLMRHRHADAARDAAVQRFSLSAMVGGYNNVYRELLRGASG